MMILFKLLQIIVGIPAFLYGIIWFITQEPDVAQWSEEQRGIYVAVSIIIIAFIISYLTIETSYFDKEEYEP